MILTERLIIKDKEFTSPPYSKDTLEFLTGFMGAVKEGGSLTGRIEIPVQMEDGSEELLVFDGLAPEEISHIVEISPQGLALTNELK